MKRIYVLLLACLCATGIMAQGQKYKQRLIDRDYYPVDSATVKVKGTQISTVTDRDGNFVLEGVPLILDSIEVTKGKKSATLPIPVRIEMKDYLIDPFAFHVRAGWGLDLAYGHGEVSASNYYAGLGIDARLGRNWFYELGFYWVRRYVKGNSEVYDYNNLEIPMMFGLKFKVVRSTLMYLKLGGYFDFVVGGSFASDYYDDYYTDSDKTTGGLAFGMGLEIRKKWLVDLTYKTGWVYGADTYVDDTYMDLAVGIGYQF